MDSDVRSLPRKSIKISLVHSVRASPARRFWLATVVGYGEAQDVEGSKTIEAGELPRDCCRRERRLYERMDGA
jgi:hypothetical protein